MTAEASSAVLAERARELARLPGGDGPGASDMQVLLLRGTCGRWALPIGTVARIEPLPQWLPLPGQPPAVLGLVLLGGRRCLVVDPEVVIAALPPRPPGRSGHAVLLRGRAVALAVDRAEEVAWLPLPPAGHRLLADGSLLVEPDRLMAAIRAGGTP